MRQQLPLYMVPSTLIVRDSIPRSPNGKFDRAKLRAEFGS
jgi:acyl-CoA synthetase (AMP-forming)/AMP-acid ligase II